MIVTSTPQKQKAYIRFIAYLQVIGIVLVVLGHSLHQYPDGYFGGSTLLYRTFLYVRMPLFMFVSGFLMIYTTGVAGEVRTTYKAFIVNKLKRLLLPFMVLTTVTFLPRTLLSSIADDTLQLSPEAFVKAFVIPTSMPIPYLWFLQASFILLVTCFLFMLFIRRIKIPAQAGVLVLCTLFAVLAAVNIDLPRAFALYKIKELGVYFALGCAYCVFMPFVDRHVPWCRWWFAALCVAAWLCFFAAAETDILPWGASLCTISGIAMCISLTRIMEAKNITFLDHLCGANYLIFLTSWFLNVLTQQVLAHYVALPWWFHTVLSLTAGVYVPWLGYQYLRTHRDSRWVRVTAFLLGQSFRK